MIHRGSVGSSLQKLRLSSKKAIGTHLLPFSRVGVYCGPVGLTALGSVPASPTAIRTRSLSGRCHEKTFLLWPLTPLSPYPVLKHGGRAAGLPTDLCGSLHETLPPPWPLSSPALAVSSSSLCVVAGPLPSLPGWLALGQVRYPVTAFSVLLVAQPGLV